MVRKLSSVSYKVFSKTMASIFSVEIQRNALSIMLSKRKSASLDTAMEISSEMLVILVALKLR